MPKGTANKQFGIESIKDDDLRAYVQRMSSTLDKQSQELKIKSLQNSVYEVIFKSADLEQLINNILDKINVSGCSSMRILVERKDSFLGEGIVKAERGLNTQSYAYLDEQITQQLMDKKQLIIPDTTKIHSIKFSPDKKFPRTIAAYHFMQTPDVDGYLWMTFEAVKEFTSYELELFSQLTSAIAETGEHFVLQEETRIKARIFAQTIEDMPLPVLVLNDKRKVVYSNQIAQEKLNGDIESIAKDQKISEWLDSKTTDVRLEYEINGDHFQVRGRRLSDGGGAKIRVLIFASDSEMHNKQSYLTLLMDTISHDFKVPLVNMQGFSKLLSMVGELNPKQEEYLSSIRSGIQEISAVVDDLFDIGRIVKEEGLRISEYSARETIEKAINLVQAEARQKRLKFERHLLPEDGKIAVDQVLVVSALYNLLTNAVKHSRIGGTITVEEKVDGNNWSVSTIDCGKGMSQIDIEKMESSRFVSKEGQGLSIVERIARFHRGSISVESELGKGSKFILQLPCFE